LDAYFFSNLVKSVINGVKTYYVGRHYHKEVDGSDSTVKKYYSAASTTIAVRTVVNRQDGTDDTLNWLLADHLGSTAMAAKAAIDVTAAADGSWFSEIRAPKVTVHFGETRWSSGITPTDYRYTGQLKHRYINLYFYGARWYDDALGRFVQPDTIIPDFTNAQSWAVNDN
jgi:RHS repeat-associated protein